MRVGIPKGLLYYKYHTFFESFYSELGAEIITSPDTNKKILDYGVKSCVDEACLPIKVFHGHVYSIKDSCDVLLIPRIMRIRDREFICPKFCGLPEMVTSNIKRFPTVASYPIYANRPDKLYDWAKHAGGYITRDYKRIKKAMNIALEGQRKNKMGINNEGNGLKVALAGHPYNVYDSYTNMNTVKKLNKLGLGVITEEFMDEAFIDEEVKKLYKRPFWTFARNSYGFTVGAARRGMVDGIVYISSFACGIDSVVIELIKNSIGNFPMLVLKIDEHTGEAGLDTRLEAFYDMLERRRKK